MADSDTPTLADLAGDLAGEAPESTDVKEEAVEQETTTEESSTEATKASDAEEATETEVEPEQADDETEEVEPQTAADKRKAELQADIEAGKQELGIDPSTEIRDFVSARKAIREAVEAKNAEVYAPQSVDEIMAETGQSQADARITAIEQRQELADYNNRVAETQVVLESESQRVFTDFPMFNPNSPNYNKPVADQAAEVLRSALQFDPNTGEVIGSSVSPYALYQTIASATQASAVENQIKGQKSTEQMLAAAEPTSSSVPKQPKEDPFLTGLTKGYGDKLSSA